MMVVVHKATSDKMLGTDHTIFKRKSFATVLHPFFLQNGPCEDI